MHLIRILFFEKWQMENLLKIISSSMLINQLQLVSVNRKNSVLCEQNRAESRVSTLFVAYCRTILRKGSDEGSDEGNERLVSGCFHSRGGSLYNPLLPCVGRASSWVQLDGDKNWGAPRGKRTRHWNTSVGWGLKKVEI